MSFAQREFRNALGAYPTGVTVVTALGPDGEDVGVTANSFTSVSMDPPLILWSLDRAAFSWLAFAAANHFAINVLAESQARLSRQFAVAGASKWSDVEFERWSSGCAILSGCVSNFECARHAAYDGGDHEILVGRVIAIRHHVGVAPLVFHQSRYRHVGPEQG
jgi:flavin reductase (DIM6/NTAB) family NADH-FMN oxidoreductase RutF